MNDAKLERDRLLLMPVSALHGSALLSSHLRGINTDTQPVRPERLGALGCAPLITVALGGDRW